MGIIVKRKRWVQGSSSEETEDTHGSTTIEAFQAEKDPYRIAPGTKIPVPYPFDSERVSPSGQKIFEAVDQRCIETLQRYDINDAKTSYRSTWRKGYKSNTKDCFILSTRSEADPIKWKEAITEVNRIIEEVANVEEHQFRVELRNPSLMYRDVTYPIPSDGPILRALSQILPILREQAHRYIPSEMIRVIGCRMRGSPFDPTSARPTAMILVAAECRYHWGLVENEISRALDSVDTEGIEVTVEIGPGILCPATVPDMAPCLPRVFTDLPNIAKNGASIGPRNTSSAGSLGVWVWYHPKNGLRRPAFLTCYHVVAEGEKNAVRRADNDERGIGLREAAGRHPIIIEYPAPFDRGVSRRAIQVRLDRGDNFKESAETLQIYAKTGIGQVEYSSGNVTNQSNRRMDWAIVVLNDQKMMGKNRVPFKIFPPEELSNGILPQPTWTESQTVEKTVAPKAGSWVAKIGRTTDIKVGEIGRLDDWIEHQSLKTSTQEVQILDSIAGVPFANLGDSGSMVVNYEGEWIGMIVAVELCSGSSYMMSSVEVLEDIKQRTGGGTISPS